jgi:trigger factor
VKSAVETLNPTRVKLTVEVPFEELKPSLDAAYRSISAQVNVPGFRKGKVPPRVIDQRFGRGAVLEEAVNDALPKLYDQAVRDSSVRPVGQPEVDITGVPDPSTGGELKFTAEVDIRPQILLPDLSALTVTVDDPDTSEDDDVQTRMDNLRARFGTLLPVERVVGDGDFVTLDLRAEIDGDEIDAVTGVSYEVGSGTMLDGLDEALLGMTAEETKTFSAPLAGGDRAGESSTVTVTVTAVKERQLPDLDDDFAQLASEFDTLEELRDSLREQSRQGRRLEQIVQAREKLLEQLLDTLDVPVPESVVEHEVGHQLEHEDREDDEEHRAEVTEQARKGVRTQFLLDAISETEQVSVEQTDLINYLVSSAQQYGMDPNEFAGMVEKSGQISSMVADIARRKALDAAIAKVNVVDAAGNPVDVSLPGPAGAEGDEGDTDEEPSGTDPTAIPVMDAESAEDAKA